MEKIILLLILFSTTNKDKSKGLLNLNINEYINNMEIDIQYTEEKIGLARKIAPLMPVEYINPINRSIHLTESLVRIMELRDYMNSKTASVQSTPIPIEDNKERLSKIVSIIQEEVPRSNMKNLGSVLELITNIDKYKRMFDIFNTVMKNQNLSKDADKLAHMVGPMMKGNSSSSGEGSLDIEKIMNIISVLNKPKEKPEHKESKDLSENKQVKDEVLEQEVKIKAASDIEVKDKEDISKLDHKDDTQVIKEKEKPNEF